MNNKFNIPPKLAVWLINKFSLSRHQNDVMGDLEEVYYQLLETEGVGKAKRWFWKQAVKSIPHFIKNNFFWGGIMFRNYFLIGIRNIKKHKGYFLINLSGLSIGLAIFILALTYVAFDLSYDNFHLDNENIYGLVRATSNANGETGNSSILPAPLLYSLKEEFSEIQDATRYYRTQKRSMKSGKNLFYEKDIIFADRNFFDFFSFTLLMGDRETILAEPNTIVLSEELAIKYFGTIDVLGERVLVDNKLDLKVVGVCDNVPINSSIKIKAVIPIETSKRLYDFFDNRESNLTQIFIKGNNLENLNNDKRFSSLLKNYYGEFPEAPDKLYFLSLADFHNKRDVLKLDSYLYKYLPNEMIQWYLSMAFILLFLVSINFINLSTSRYLTRVKEVGLRKVIGAERKQLILQFLGESVLLCVMALPIALIIFELIKNEFMTLLGVPMNLNLWDYPEYSIIVFCSAILLGVVSGVYPALYLSKFRPTQIFSSSGANVRSKSKLRKILVVSQFGVSFLLIVFTFSLHHQFKKMAEYNMGFERENTILVQVTEETRPKLELLKEAFVQHPSIYFATSSNYIPGKWSSHDLVKPEGTESGKKWKMYTYGTDYNFTKALNMKLVEGRGFSKNYNDENSVIINQTAQKQLGWDNPIGKEIEYDNSKLKVVGVVEDYIFHNVHFPISPAIMYLEPQYASYIILKHSEQEDLNTLKNFLNDKWSSIVTELPVEFSTLELEYTDGYKYLGSIFTITRTFGIIAAFFSLLGLIGLASFNTSGKGKEIGIRKVMGASSAGLLMKMLNEFLGLVVLANFIFLPITIYLLEKFMTYAWAAIPTPIPVSVYVLTFFYSILSASVAVLYQSLKAASANPVESLKYE